MSGERRASRIIRCPACQRYYRMTGAPPEGTRLRCTKCGEVFTLGQSREAASPQVEPAKPAAKPAASPRPGPAAGSEENRPRGRVLVATDGPEFHSIIGEVLRAEGYVMRPARAGEEAWNALESWGPHVALLDVALPGIPAFELCERVRAHGTLSGTGLVLIASVFQHTRYKRAPTSLYGADDYIEKHHIRDALPGKISRLLPAEQSLDAPGPETRIDERDKENLIREELYGPKSTARKNVDRLRENLKRYARIIVSDIALYNEALVDRGIREGSFYSVLKKELEEGRRLYLTRVPAASPVPDHFSEAVQEFINKRSGGGG